MKIKAPIAALLFAFAFAAPAAARIVSQPWGATQDDGRKADLYTLTNDAGMEARITNYGGVIVSLRVPGRDGAMANVVQGFDSLADYTSADYLKTHGHYGAIIGRYANRIKGGAVTIDGKSYALDPDDAGDADHGGEMAYFRQVFDAAVKDGPEPRLTLTHTDPDGFMGFPGTVKVTVTYTLLKSNTLQIDYRAATDKPTIVNMTNHAYFNLAGDGPGTVDGQEMQLFAGHYLPVTTSGGAVPTGEIRAVAGTPFDFLHPSPIGPHLADPQVGKGLDHTYVIDGTPGALRIAAQMNDPKSGPCPGSVDHPARHAGLFRQWRAPAGGAEAVKHYVPHGAMSFQTQHHPDSPNHPNFPSTELRPGEAVPSGHAVPLSPSHRGRHMRAPSRLRRPAWRCPFRPRPRSPRDDWGAAPDGGKVGLYTLTNAKGIEASITNYGGIIQSIKVPGRDGAVANVVQGFDSIDGYTRAGGRYGALIGRFANRIAGQTYALDGVTYHVTRDGKPYDLRVWNATPVNGAEPKLILKLDDPAGTMGFPGTAHVTVTYTLTNRNVLRIDYRATTDKDTVMSLTNHSYFNLAGAASGPVLDQLLMIDADNITPGDATNTPTGELKPVSGTAFDFRAPTPIGAHINDPDPLLVRAKGYDQNYAINGVPGTLRLAARLEDPKSGRVLEEWTTQAGVQVYTANYSTREKGFDQHSAVALEAQAFPNAPNIANFPSAEVTPRKPLHEITEFRFLIDKAK